MNQRGVIDNVHQQVDLYKRVVTVCSGGCLRSPTAAVVLAGEPFNFNTRSAGLTDEYAIIKLDESLIEWADEFVVMELWMEGAVMERYEQLFGLGYQGYKPIKVLNIPDHFKYRDPELAGLITESYAALEEEEL